MPYLLGGGGGGGGAPLDGGGGGGFALTPLEGFPEDFAPPESKDALQPHFKSHLFIPWTCCNARLYVTITFHFILHHFACFKFLL